METNPEDSLNQIFDGIIHQLTKGNTIERLKKGIKYSEFHQFKEWKSKYGYQFHVYSNDHLIDSKPHFHILKKSENIDCRFLFNGQIYDCKGKRKPDKKVLDALKYLLEDRSNLASLILLWNNKNPRYKISHP